MKSVSCPICDKRMDHQGPKEWPAWPFCSDRCRLVDLGRWLKQDYAVPVADSRDDKGKQAAPDGGAGDSEADDD
jgi:endogenous inhibitor of DNA gyrase (YacG/DUF329 family)